MVDAGVSLDHEVRRQRFVFLGLRHPRSESDRNRDQSQTQIPQIDLHDFLSASWATPNLGLSGPYLKREILRDGELFATVTDHSTRPYRPQFAGGDQPQKGAESALRIGDAEAFGSIDRWCL